MTRKGMDDEATGRGLYEEGRREGESRTTTKGKYRSGVLVQDTVTTVVGYTNLEYALFTRGYLLVLLGLILLVLVHWCWHQQITWRPWGAT